MSLDYESLFSKIDKAKKKKKLRGGPTVGNTGRRADGSVPWNSPLSRKILADAEEKKRTDINAPTKYTRTQRRSDRQRDKVLGESSESTSGVLTAAQRKARAAQAKLHGTKISTETEPEHITRIKLTPEQIKTRETERARKYREGKDKETEERMHLGSGEIPIGHYTRDKPRRGGAGAGYTQAQGAGGSKSKKQEDKERVERELRSRKNRIGLVPGKHGLLSGTGTPERQAEEKKVEDEYKKERETHKLLQDFGRWNKMSEEAKRKKEEGVDEKTSTTGGSKKKTPHAADQAAEYKKLMQEAGRGGGKPIKARSESITAKRSRQDRKARAVEVDKDPVEDIPDIEADNDEEVKKSIIMDYELWKAGWKDEGFESEAHQKEYQDQMGKDAPTPKGWKDIKTTRAARKRTRSGRTDDKETQSALHHGPDEVHYDAQVAGYGRNNPREEERNVPLSRVGGTATETAQQMGITDSALGEARGVKNILHHGRQGFPKGKKEAEKESDKLSRQRTMDRVLAETLRGKALAIKIKYERGDTTKSWEVWLEKNKKKGRKYPKHEYDTGRKDTMGRAIRSRYKTPEESSAAQTQQTKDWWLNNRERARKRQIRYNAEEFGTGAEATPEQEAKRKKARDRRQLMSEGRHQTGQGSKWDKRFTEGKWRREVGFDVRVGTKRRKTPTSVDDVHGGDEEDKAKRVKYTQAEEEARKKLSPKEYAERKYGHEWKDPEIYGKKGIHPKKLHNVSAPTLREDAENKIQAGIEALKGALGALGEGKVNPYTGKKRKLGKPREQYRLDEFESEKQIDEKVRKKREKKEADKSDYYMDAGGNPQRKEKADENGYTEEEKKDPGVWTPKISDLRTISERLNPKNPKHEYWRKYYNRNEIYKKPKFDPKQSDANKAEEGMGGMLMGAQRGLGHEAGYKQDPGQSAQITEVIEEELGNESKKKAYGDDEIEDAILDCPYCKGTGITPKFDSDCKGCKGSGMRDHLDVDDPQSHRSLSKPKKKAQSKPIKPQVVKEPNKVMDVVDEAHPKAEQINEKVRAKIESLSVKSAYENHEQDASPETEPNKQQIPFSKPKPDVFDNKKMYKKALAIKYNNLYKPLNT